MIFSLSKTDTAPSPGTLIGIAKIVCFFLRVLAAKRSTSLALISSSLLSRYGNTMVLYSNPALAAIKDARKDHESWMLLKPPPCEPALSPLGAVITWTQTYADSLPTT